VEAAPDKERPPGGRGDLELGYAAGCDPLVFQLVFEAGFVFAYVCSTVWESVPVCVRMTDMCTTVKKNASKRERNKMLKQEQICHAAEK
jgi:hypothetical protein